MIIGNVAWPHPKVCFLKVYISNLFNLIERYVLCIVKCLSSNELFIQFDLTQFNEQKHLIHSKIETSKTVGMIVVLWS